MLNILDIKYIIRYTSFDIIKIIKKMQYQEKRSLTTLIGTLILGSGFAIYLYNKSKDSGIDFENDLQFWGKSFLIFCGISIVSLIIVHIIFHIINAIATGEKENATLEDERDKIIELKTSKVSQSIFLMGFMLAMVFMAMGKPVSFMFLTLIFSGFIGGMIEEVVKIIYYRHGDVFKICQK